MPPAIAIASRVRLTLARLVLVRCNLLQHQSGCFGVRHLTRESFSFESLLVSFNATAAAVAGLGVCWVLLCKNCVAVCGAYARRALFIEQR